MEWSIPTTVLVCLGLLFGGDIFVIPFVLTGSNDYVDYLMLTLLIAVTTVMSDTFWYLLGRILTYGRVIEWPLIRSRRATIDSLLDRVGGRIVFFVFLSKFVYGTRMTVQVVCGLRKASYTHVMAASVLGAWGWLAALVALHSGVMYGVSFFPESNAVLGIGVALFIVLVVALHYFISQWLRSYFR